MATASIRGARKRWGKRGEAHSGAVGKVKRVRIAAVGEVTEDCYQTGQRSLGGISVNFARAAMHAGAACALYAPVGDDARGERLREALVKEAVAPLRLRTLAGASAEQQIRMTESGERIFCGFEAGVLLDYQLTDDELQELRGYDAVALPCSPESKRVFLQCMAAALDVPIVADFSQESPIGEPGDPAGWIAPYADRLRIAFVGGDETFVEPLRALSERTAVLIALTVGAGGAYALSRGKTHRQASLATTVVDTTGCGDAFAAGFCVAHFAGAPIVACLRAASELAAHVAAKHGAAP
jgi:sugar/nucleoside kinase (ribokinase family)